MLKGNQTHSGHSPSVTPQCAHTKSKSVCSNRKPPCQLKKSVCETKPSKLSKRPKTRTSSFTPKPVQMGLFDRGFHNSNLSDTDVSSKLVDFTYTNSKLKSSLLGKPEVNSKIKEAKEAKDVKLRKNIEKIIKKSLIKAKNLRLSQDKMMKETRIEKEIKKNELFLQNRQIRMQNLTRCRKRKKSKKKSEVEQSKNLEISGKFKKFVAGMDEGCRRKKGTNSVDFNQMKFRSDHEIIELVGGSKGNGRDESLRYMERVAAEISRASQLEKDVFKNNKRSLQDLNNSFDESIKVERNISFIEEVSDLGLFSKRSYSKLDNYSSEISKEKTLISAEEAVLRIQTAYRKHLINKYLKLKTRPKLSTSTNKISIKPQSKPLNLISFPLTLNTQVNSSKVVLQSSIKIQPSSKPKQVLSISRVISIEINPIPKKNLKLETLKPVLIISKDKSGQLNKLVQEQIAQNLSQINIIEQLRLEELSLVESLTRSNPEQGTYLTTIHSKYKSLILQLKSLSKDLQSPYLNCLSVQDYSVLKKKQQNYEETLKNSIKSNLTLNFSISVSQNDLDFQEQVSSDISSDEIEKIGGISHSYSKNELFNEASQGKYNKNQDLAAKPLVLFNFTEQSDDQFYAENFNLALDEEDMQIKCNNKDLPSLPPFSLSAFDNFSSELPVSDARILTSTESVVDYAKDIFMKLDFNLIMNEIVKPIKRDPLTELQRIINKPIGTCIDLNIYYLPKIIDVEAVLRGDDSGSDFDSTVREIGKADYIHKKMILNVIDALLQELRPYGLLGEPLPWERRPIDIRRKLNEEQTKKRILKELEIFSFFQIGRIFNDEILQQGGGINSDIIECLREEKLEKAILYEAIMEEDLWVSYQFEEIQTILDLTDLILEDLSGEVVDICNE